ncbi:DUF2793 domain-containing protein [Henriciella litoralis]|uniref:DUF2793 domain-containing protein n=1 Tax=Henriciella litoralis TaxID=568102 RepID=UPI00146EEBEA|nr:DUF2793 domain-containing protein [Henriciella litoralis]
MTLNDSLKRLDLLVHLSVKSATLSEEPGDPQNGDAYILPSEPTGPNWSGRAQNTVAAFQDSSWTFVEPGIGWQAYIEDEMHQATNDGTNWARPVDVGSLTELGVNTQPDTVNRFAVKADAELLSHDDVTPGTGDVRKILNKAGTAQTSAILFQSDWSACGEIGLIGNDELSIRVSPDGSAFSTAARFDSATGSVSFPRGQVHPGSGARTRSIIPLSGEDSVCSIFRLDPARLRNPREYTLAEVSGTTLRLNEMTANTLFDEARMAGVSMVRIWNTSKSPAQPAWVCAAPTGDCVEVYDATSISGWGAGDIIQLGDPDTITSGRVIAVDVSPMMEALFGQSFPQSGVLIKLAAAAGPTGESGLQVTPDGRPGTFLGVRGYAGAESITGQYVMNTQTPSPISSANLIFVREMDFGGGVGVSIASLTGLLV